jgi:hypothetical protein
MLQQTRADVVEEATRLLEESHERGVMLRLIGGLAVRLHSHELPTAFDRPYRDIDVVTSSKGGRDLSRFLVDVGYEANDRFNALNGQTRMVFYDLQHGRQLDVFVGEFAMCHRIQFGKRLELDERTIPLAELLLTKLQVVQLNEKDLRDIYAIVHEHDVGEHDDETINAEHTARLLAGDWGFWRTAKQTIETAVGHLGDLAIDSDERHRIADRLGRLWGRIEAEPKSLRWRSRAKIGERTRWYEEPEEIAHADIAPPTPAEPT